VRYNPQRNANYGPHKGHTHGMPTPHGDIKARHRGTTNIKR